MHFGAWRVYKRQMQNYHFGRRVLNTFILWPAENNIKLKKQMFFTRRFGKVFKNFLADVENKYLKSLNV